MDKSSSLNQNEDNTPNTDKSTQHTPHLRTPTGKNQRDFH